MHSGLTSGGWMARQGHDPARNADATLRNPGPRRLTSAAYARRAL